MIKQSVIHRKEFNTGLGYEDFDKFVIRVTDEMNKLQSHNPYVSYPNDKLAVITYS